MKKSVLLSFTLISWMVAGCTQTGSGKNQSVSSAASDAIIGGSPASEPDVQTGGRLNSVVGIWVPNTMTSGSLCSGTLIAPQLVLTAGHCLRHMSPNKMIQIHFQTLDLNNPSDSADELSSSMKSNKYEIHPNFVKALAAGLNYDGDDIALIALPNPAPASVHPMNLPPENFALSSANSLASAGYGVVDDHHNANAKGDGILNFTHFEKNEFWLFNPELIYASSPTTGVCFGDSGGPLFVDTPAPLLVGVAESIETVYTGDENLAFQLAEMNGKIDDFFKTYPDAHDCSGLSKFINVASYRQWIQQASARLLGGN